MQVVQAPVIWLQVMQGDEQVIVVLLEDDVLKLDTNIEFKTLIPAIMLDMREELRDWY